MAIGQNHCVDEFRSARIGIGTQTNPSPSPGFMLTLRMENFRVECSQCRAVFEGVYTDLTLMEYHDHFTRQGRCCPEKGKPLIELSKYFTGAEALKAQDVKNGATFTIESFEEVNTQLGLRPLLRFVDVDKGFFLNKTNLTRLVEIHGNNEAKWRGKKVKLIHAMAPNPSQGGKETKTLRIS